MKRIKGFVKQKSLTVAFILRHFLTMLGAAAICFAGMLIFNRVGIVLHNVAPLAQVLIFALVSLFVGTFFSACALRRPLKPFSQLLDALSTISKGDYSVRLELRGPRRMQELNDSFNQMAGDLGSVELLRTDFVNNFSHEFKTPIVSIGGFAKMLKRDDLAPEERHEYLDIIVSESERLAELSTNVLMLSKIEHQHILTDKKPVNISEQIRLTVALLEKKWSQKQLDIQFDSGEVSLVGNEELLRQVWLNLLDNAVKFSPDHGRVKLEVRKYPGDTVISISNEGKIREEVLAHIFDRFYQGDRSHTQQGNGLGLPIAQRIVELHGGALSAKCTPNGEILFQCAFFHTL